MRKILLIDDDENLLSSMAELFDLVLGVPCIPLRTFAQAVAIGPKRLCDEIDAAILDINLGVDEPSGIDVYHWLRGQSFRGKIIFLTGHAKDHPLVKKVAQLEDVDIFEKPLGIDGILSLITEELKTDRPQAS